MRLHNLIPCQAKLILYKTAIMPHLTYCHLVWNFCKSSDGRKIERIQERALRAVFKTTTEIYEELLKRAKLPMLHNLRLQDVAVLMYKVKNDLEPSYISEIFTRNDNLLLTEREGRTGEYWPEVVAVRTERSEVRTKTTEDQYSSVRLELARLVSSLLYGTRAMFVLHFPAFENKKICSL